MFFSASLLLLRILRSRLLRWILRRLANRLAQSRSRLHSRLSHSEIILRGIPDKFEEAIISCFVVNHDGRLVDLAPNSDNVATDDRRRVPSWNCLGSCVTLIRAYARSSCCWWICAGA